MCTRGDIITRADLAGDWPASRAEASCDAVDELVIVSNGRGAEIVEQVRCPIAALPAARWAARCAEWSGERSLDDAVAIEPALERRPAQPRR